MLALLSSPVRRFLLITLLVPAIAFLLSKVGGFLQRRNGGEHTRISRALVSASGFLRRRVAKNDDHTRGAVRAA
ncbi:hypothetical protein TUM20985_53420 [Mycobacterium antarcticum]|uniref:hypothetical protein n=1 Tax=unclassified Mycolicibacterium TaxID=2636767 RepID=UPI00239723D7|nr:MULTISPECIES: hypothetical protein [unclassified Mycolicibacterium]BDX34795.1 hypothetical protein TUM20985_53420 [Mycolicibacterium sp. TUM20985]GLP81601.1 hypothetical protein TUM20984_30210 [Mycolicibacterium sp. TUM20984]